MNKEKRNADSAVASVLNKKQKPNDEDVLPKIHEQLLANMLNHLPMEDLMKIAEKDERSLPAIAIIFKERHLEKDTLCLTNIDGMFLTNECLNEAIVETFGDNIRTLHLIYDDDYRPYDFFLEKFVEDNLTESFIRIKFVNPGPHTLVRTKKRFEKVANLYFDCGTLSTAFSRFIRLFPNVEELSLKNLKIRNPDDYVGVEKCWPQLNYFRIENIDGEISRIANFIMTNEPKYLSIERQKHVDEFLALISKKRSNLPDLTLKIRLGVENVGMGNVHFKKLNSFWISGLQHKLNIRVDEMMCLELNERYESDAIITGHWIDLIKSARKLEALEINGKWENDAVADQYIDVIKKIPHLKEIYMIADLEFKKIVDIIIGCSSLKRFRVKTSLNLNYELMRRVLNQIGLSSELD